MKMYHFFLTCALLNIMPMGVCHAITPIDTASLTLAMADPTRPDITKTVITNKPKVLKKRKRNKKKSFSRLSLQQTIISNRRKIAVINGRSMTIGKKIQGAKLISISQDNVVLTYGGKNYTLNLTSPSTVKERKR